MFSITLNDSELALLTGVVLDVVVINISNQYPVARSPSCSWHLSPCLVMLRKCLYVHSWHTGPTAYRCLSCCSWMNSHPPAAQTAWRALCLIWQ